MNHILRSALFVVVAMLASGAACQNNNSGAGGGSASKGVTLVSAENPELVIARYSGKEVKLKDVDAAVGDKLRELEKQKLELRKQGADQLVVQALVKEEAAKAGKTEEAWLRESIDAKVPPPSEEAIMKVFEENKAQMPPGSTIDGVRPQIINYLQQDQKRTVALGVFDELKKKAGFEMLLQEPRIEVEAKGPSKGAADAKVTIVEFSDFQCPFCSKAEPSIDEVMQKFNGKVRVVFRHFPLSFHDKAVKAAEAASCAEEQGKFWEFHKHLFANQGKLDVPDLKEHAGTLGLDAAKFAECLDSGRMKAKVDADMAAGSKAGVNGTPAFFINGRLLSGALPYSEFEKIITAELK